MQMLLDGSIAPRQFVSEFFELTEAGNMRNDIRKKLVLSLLLSGTVRPSVKFLMLENFERLAKPVRLAIISAVLKAEPTRHTEIIKEELKYMVAQDLAARDLTAQNLTEREVRPDRDDPLKKLSNGLKRR